MCPFHICSFSMHRYSCVYVFRMLHECVRLHRRKQNNITFAILSTSTVDCFSSFNSMSQLEWELFHLSPRVRRASANVKCSKIEIRKTIFWHRSYLLLLPSPNRAHHSTNLQMHAHRNDGKHQKQTQNTLHSSR